MHQSCAKHPWFVMDSRDRFQGCIASRLPKPNPTLSGCAAPVGQELGPPLCLIRQFPRGLQKLHGARLRQLHPTTEPEAQPPAKGTDDKDAAAQQKEEQNWPLPHTHRSLARCTQHLLLSVIWHSCQNAIWTVTSLPALSDPLSRPAELAQQRH